MLTMTSFNKILAILGAVMTMSTCTAAFFWGSSEPVKQPPTPWPVAFYQQRFLQASPPVYSGPPPPLQEQPGGPPVQIPAIPIQVPLQAQLTPTANIHNVQLVPCLCPVSQDYEFESKPQENIYTNQIKPQN